MTATDAPGAPGRALLAHAGTTLFGQQWQGELAAALGCTDRLVRYWLAGTTQIPARVWPQIAQLARDRGIALADLTKLLTALTPEGTPP